jgi:hypothetical protein
LAEVAREQFDRQGGTMTSTIYVLAWGSLIWNPRELKTDGEWQKGGPILPIEFSRKSKRGNLSLVIDEKNGAPVSVRYSKSGFTSLADAVENLRVREEASDTRNMGYVDFRTGEIAAAAKGHPSAVDIIRAWGSGKGWDAVIWTALPPNFPEQGVFSPELALRHLELLQGEVRSRAFEYIRRAPEEVVTPVRTLASDLVASD